MLNKSTKICYKILDGKNVLCLHQKKFFSASDVIPHDRTRIPILPQRAISTAAQAFPMQPRSFSTIAQAFPLQPRSFSTAAQEPGIQD